MPVGLMAALTARAPAVALPMRRAPAVTLLISPLVRPRVPAVLVPTSIGRPPTEFWRVVMPSPLLSVPLSDTSAAVIVAAPPPVVTLLPAACA